MTAHTDEALLQTIDRYWDERSTSYDASIKNELATETKERWRAELISAIPRFGTAQLRVLDIGCGPGFLSILAAEQGCVVDALDYSENMLATARENASFEEVSHRIRFQQGDAQNLPFADDTFDVVISRNVTWNLEDPHHAYAEWHRVLKPGGRLVNFDANWYAYLVDDLVDRERKADQADSTTLDQPADCRATDDQCSRCERIAAALPLTRAHRPGWDLNVLAELGFSRLFSDTSIHQRVWTPGEEAFYASSPLFMVVGVK